MKRILILIMLMQCAYSNPSVAFTIGEYSAQKDEKAISFYLAGVGAGYYYANNYLTQALSKQPLYCQPESENIAGDSYKRILDTYLAAKHDEIEESVSVEIVLLIALAQMFPCL